MRRKVPCLVVLAASAAAMCGAAIAQDRTPEVKVEASRVIKKEVGKSTTGAPIETAEITMRVSYADLSLDTNSGQALFRSRVEDAAKDACARLSASTAPGNPTTSDEECVRSALDGAKPQVDAAIAGYARR